MAHITRIFLPLCCVFALIAGCVSTPPPVKTTPVENRETSVMTEREAQVIDVNEKLFKASFNGNASDLKNVLETEADVEVKMKDAWTALLLASGMGHPEIMRVLIDAGVNVNEATSRGGTALMWAAGARQNSAESVRVLLDAGAKVNAKTTDGCTALMDAVMHGNTSSVEVLLSAGANVNEQTEDGVTALMESARLGHGEIVQLLLSSGAEMNIRNREGRTALMEARDAARDEIVRLLRDAGALD
jgi:ankyrin repeat protein